MKIVDFHVWRQRKDEQDAMVDGIINFFHRNTGENYIKIFCQQAQLALEHLASLHEPVTAAARIISNSRVLLDEKVNVPYVIEHCAPGTIYMSCVVAPIRAFATSEAEERFLLQAVQRKMADIIAMPHVFADQRSVVIM